MTKSAYCDGLASARSHSPSMIDGLLPGAMVALVDHSPQRDAGLLQRPDMIRPGT